MKKNSTKAVAGILTILTVTAASSLENNISPCFCSGGGSSGGAGAGYREISAMVASNASDSALPDTYLPAIVDI